MRTPLICNLNAIPTDRLPRYRELRLRLASAVRESRKLPTGWELSLDERAIAGPELAEWMGLERLCCPFLTLTLEATAGRLDWRLRVTGLEGASEILAELFERQAS